MTCDLERQLRAIAVGLLSRRATACAEALNLAADLIVMLQDVPHARLATVLANAGCVGAQRVADLVHDEARA